MENVSPGPSIALIYAGPEGPDKRAFARRDTLDMFNSNPLLIR